MLSEEQFNHYLKKKGIAQFLSSETKFLPLMIVEKFDDEGAVEMLHFLSKNQRLKREDLAKLILDGETAYTKSLAKGFLKTSDYIFRTCPETLKSRYYNDEMELVDILIKKQPQNFELMGQVIRDYKMFHNSYSMSEFVSIFNKTDPLKNPALVQWIKKGLQHKRMETDNPLVKAGHALWSLFVYYQPLKFWKQFEKQKIVEKMFFDVPLKYEMNTPSGNVLNSLAKCLKDTEYKAVLEYAFDEKTRKEKLLYVMEHYPDLKITSDRDIIKIFEEVPVEGKQVLLKQWGNINKTTTKLYPQEASKNLYIYVWDHLVKNDNSDKKPDLKFYLDNGLDLYEYKEKFWFNHTLNFLLQKNIGVDNENILLNQPIDWLTPISDKRFCGRTYLEIVLCTNTKTENFMSEVVQKCLDIDPQKTVEAFTKAEKLINNNISSEPKMKRMYNLPGFKKVEIKILEAITALAIETKNLKSSSKTKPIL